jgi:type II secretory pathway component PulK
MRPARGGLVRGRDGFVLLAVLWLLVALAAVALDVSVRTKGRRTASANLLDQRQARAAALAGAEYARAHLTSAMLGRAEELRSEAESRQRRGRERRPPSLDDLFEDSDPAEDPWRDPVGLLNTDMAFGDGQYFLNVRDTGASLNPNEASEVMLRQFFAQGLRVDYADADRITQAILDWRDEDDIPRVGGGERDQYVRAGAAVLPTNRIFDDITELRYVLGMTEEIFAEAAPYLTVTSSGDINLNAAPEPVLLALPGMTPAGAAELIRLRESGTYPRRDRDLQELLPRAAADAIEDADEDFERRVTYTTEEVEIVSEGSLEGSSVRVRIRMVVGRSDAGAVVVWRKLDL